MCFRRCLLHALAASPWLLARPAWPQDEPAPGARIEGFRQARFGMAEQPLRQAVARDFPAAAARLTRSTHPRERTTVLTLPVEDLLPGTGTAQVSYILGYRSRELVQVNVVWTADGRTPARDEAVVAAANMLRDHFLAQHRPPDEIVANHVLDANAILVFRARQPDGRAVVLLLSGTAAAGRAAQPAAPPLALQLSYIRDQARPDVFSIERGRF